MQFKASIFMSGCVKVVAYHAPKTLDSISNVALDNSFDITPPVMSNDDSGLGRSGRGSRREIVDIDTGEILPYGDSGRSGQRSKTRFLEYALNHDWGWFLTLTLDPLKHDRHTDHMRGVAQWLKDARRRKYPGLEYALVPEQHKDGAWHYHALLSGVPSTALSDSGKKLRGRAVFVWDDAVKSWGWSTMSPVDGSDRAVRYISKYMTKSLMGSARGSGMRRWSVSSGVKRCVFRSVDRPAIGRVDGSEWYEVASDGQPVAWVRWGSVGDAWVNDLMGAADNEQDKKD